MLVSAFTEPVGTRDSSACLTQQTLVFPAVSASADLGPGNERLTAWNWFQLHPRYRMLVLVWLACCFVSFASGN